jgi:hypothetical protein
VEADALIHSASIRALTMAIDFQCRIEDPHSWFIFADISLRAAGVLWDVSDHGRRMLADTFSKTQSYEGAVGAGGALQMSIPSLLLSGLGFESLLKGIRLRQMYYRGEPLTAVSKKGIAVLVGHLKTHNLKSLAQQAGVPLDTGEETLLDRLTTIVTWAGRYPVSIGENGLVPGAGEYTPADGHAVGALARKLFDFADSSPQLIGVGRGGERIEMVKTQPKQWRVQHISAGAVNREAYGDRSPDVYQIALNWNRELNRAEKN